MKNEKDPADPRLPYEVPKAVNLGSPVKGSGLCSNGSGDSENCLNGNSALLGCGDGNAPILSCIAGTGD